MTTLYNISLHEGHDASAPLFVAEILDPNLFNQGSEYPVGAQECIVTLLDGRKCFLRPNLDALHHEASKRCVAVVTGVQLSALSEQLLAFVDSVYDGAPGLS